MKLYRLILIFVASLFSHSLHALIITDTISFNETFAKNEFYVFEHDFTDDGFLPGIDKIIAARISFDFWEIEEGDSEYQEDEPLPDDWEFIIIYSRVFDGRLIMSDVNTGVFSDYLVGSHFGELSETGKTMTTIESYTNNLWLGTVVMEIEIERAFELSEPSPLVILGLGLIILGWTRQKIGRKH